MLTVPIVTLEALNNFANESSGEANLLLRRSGDIDLEATVVLETSNIQPLPNPAAGNQSVETGSPIVSFLSRQKKNIEILGMGYGNGDIILFFSIEVLRMLCRMVRSSMTFS